MKTSFKTLSFIFFIPFMLLIFSLHSQAEEEVSAQEKDIRLVDDGKKVSIEETKERILKGDPVLSVKKQEEAKRTIRSERITNALKKKYSVKKRYLGIYFVTPSDSLKSSIFGFAQFISALALLVIVFTISGILYRFRVAVVPIHLFSLTFRLLCIIGFGTLFTDIWFTMQWPTPNFLIYQAIWQGVFGFVFLLLIIMWIYYAFIKPPIFCKGNGEQFFNKLYEIILNGSDNDLPVIAYELRRSASSLVEISKRNPTELGNDNSKNVKAEKYKPKAEDYAYEILLLIGSRKLCRHIIASSPMTAIYFLYAMEDNKKYDLPIGQFVRNISTEAIINKDSTLYHEDEGYKSGLIGYHKHFSQALYGNSRLVSALGARHESPFDLDYEIMDSLDALQLKAYSRVTIISMKSHLKDHVYDYSSPLHRAFGKIVSCCNDVYKLNDIPSNYYTTDIYKRLYTVVDFIKEAITVLCEYRKSPATRLRRYKDRDQWHNKDIYDHIASHMFEIIFLASKVTAPIDKCWSIHHNIVWDGFFGMSDDKIARKNIQYKLRRLIYEEILRLGEFPNFKSSSILGICLNVMGLKIRDDKKGLGEDYYSLHKVVLTWTRKNYLLLKSTHPKIAKSCLIGSISFDEQSKSLVKTYGEILGLKVSKEYLKLSE